MEVRMEMLALATLLLIIGHASTQDSGDETGQDPMLRQRNQKLEMQMNRLKLVWSGLQQFCSALSMSDCDCETDAKTLPEKTQPLDNAMRLRVLSVKSSGNRGINDTLSLTVFFTAHENHVTEWLLGYNKYGKSSFVKTGGATVNTSNTAFYTRTVVLDASKLIGIFLRIISGHEIAYMTFNLEQILVEGVLEVPKYTSGVLAEKYTHAASTDEDLNITFRVSGTWRDETQLEHYTKLEYVGITTLTGSPKIFQASSFDEDIIAFSWYPDINNSTSVVVTVKQPHVSQGGVLYALFPPTNSNLGMPGRFVDLLLYGHVINILSPGNNEAIPKDMIEIHPWGERTVTPLPHTINCVVVGNPLPEVEMFKIQGNGQLQMLETESIKLNNFMQNVLYWLPIEHHKENNGNYTCRAVRGNSVVEVTTQVVVFTPPIFDEKRTTVVKNNSNKVVFGCKATADEPLDLEFRLYHSKGPNLAMNEQYKISHFTSGKKHARISLTASPPDYRLQVVVCVASVYGIETYREIQLFPGLSPGWDDGLYNTTLYG